MNGDAVPRRPKLGVCYYPKHWPEERWATDAAMMRAAGISVVRIGEFAWSRLEPEPGELRLDWLERVIETLQSAGLEVVLGTPTVSPPKWLVDLPALRNVAATAPYMHDGRFATLEEVLAHYNDPPLGRLGHQELNPLELSPDQIEQIVAFLGTLTGPAPSAPNAAATSATQ